MIVTETHSDGELSVRRLVEAGGEDVSTVGRWVGPRRLRKAAGRKCPVSGDASLRSLVRELCDMTRHRTYGYRRIWELLRRRGHKINKETVRRMMRGMGLSRPKICYKPKRTKHVEKMRPVEPNRGWQIDVRSFVLSYVTTLYLVMVTDCYTRKIVGWSLERSCRAGEWVSALRMGLESQGLVSKELCRGLVVRSDNAYVERVIRTVKEEEVWPNLYDSLSEARSAMEDYINYYNNERIHSALAYQTPSEFAAAHNTLAAA